MPAEERVKVEIRYATAYFERGATQFAWHPGRICTATADCSLPGRMIRQEGERWVVTPGGYRADAPPLDRGGFVPRAQRMAPEIAGSCRARASSASRSAIASRTASCVAASACATGPRGCSRSAMRWSSFKPIYGQGMTVAACDAMALGGCLAAGRTQLAPRCFGRAARFVDVARDPVVSADLAIPSVEGARPLWRACSMRPSTIRRWRAHSSRWCI